MHVTKFVVVNYIFAEDSPTVNMIFSDIKNSVLKGA